MEGKGRSVVEGNDGVNLHMYDGSIDLCKSVGQKIQQGVCPYMSAQEG